jgi:uncharacterized protein YjbI with pentapeptide repeats
MADKAHTSPQCRHHGICGRDIEGNPADGSCILHSTNPAKDADAFAAALAIHRERHGDNFTWFVFPEATNFIATNFMMKWFGEGANFLGATFTGDISFYEARFRKSVSFWLAKFNKHVNFGGTRFFSDFTSFTGATFSGGANFRGAVFSGFTSFDKAAFSEGADFSGATFSGYADFSRATFSGKTLFSGRPGNAQTRRIFAGTTVDFRQVVMNPPDAITFLGADLTTCRFLDTDLRKVQLVDIEWPKRRGRVLVYDEIVSVATEDGDKPPWAQQIEKATGKLHQQIEQLDREFTQNDEVAPIETEDRGGRPWPQLERLYRELKQNYEDRRDYERAGDFHYGEKEMRRKNPDTAWGLRVFLRLYQLFSGYGERYLRPLLWALVLLLVATVGYLWGGLAPKASLLSTKPETTASLVMPGAVSRPAPLPLTQPDAWLSALHYSFRVMTLLKPDDLEPMGFAKVVQTLESLLGPLFLGLFALALRQRLKR